MYYVGLTDTPDQRKKDHGNPADWTVTPAFVTEQVARNWEKELLKRLDISGGTGGAGWHYGYWYTITTQTRE